MTEPRCGVCGGPPNRSGAYCDDDSFHGTQKPPDKLTKQDVTDLGQVLSEALGCCSGIGKHKDDCREEIHGNTPMTDDATKRAHEAVRNLFGLRAGSVDDVHAAIDAAVKAAEEAGWKAGKTEVVTTHLQEIAEKAAAEMRESILAAGLCGRCRENVRALPLKGESDG